MELDLQELTAKAHYSHIGLPFPEWWKNNKKALVFPNLNKIFDGDGVTGKYFFKVSFKHQGEIITLPNEPLVALSLVKTIVETATVGKYRKGTVKEYINTEDYQISIKGVCVNTEDANDFPAKQVSVLNKLFSINESLEVHSNRFFELFGIRKIVLKDINFADMMGQPNLQAYTITAVSDQDFFADLLERERQ